MNSTVRPMWVLPSWPAFCCWPLLGCPLASEESPFYLAAASFPTSQMKLSVVTALGNARTSALPRENVTGIPGRPC